MYRDLPWPAKEKQGSIRDLRHQVLYAARRFSPQYAQEENEKNGLSHWTTPLVRVILPSGISTAKAISLICHVIC
jgi:hypothetical protein